MRYTLSLAATIAVASATNYTPCGNLCAGGTAPSRVITTESGDQFAVCLGTDFPGADIEGDKGGLVMNLEEGDVDALAEACSNTDGCVAATMNGQFGYLKRGVPQPFGEVSGRGGDDSIFQIMCDDTATTTTTTAAATTTSSMTTTSASTTSASTTTTAARTTTASTTTKASTTTSASGSGPTPPVKCPKDEEDIVESGGQYFYKFWSGKCKRNSFSSSHGITFPRSTSEDDATQKCADWIASKPRDPYPLNFQIYLSNKDNTWHCDATRSLNTDLNFLDNRDVDRMLQYNPLPGSCKPSKPTPPAKCPHKKTIVTSKCGSSPASYALVYYANGKRNGFQTKNSESYDGRLSWDGAIQKCANFISKQLPNVAPSFQVLYSNPERRWYCASSATVNTDSNWKENKDIKHIFQFNAVPKGCPTKRDIFSSNISKRTYYSC
ncbi:hypothetical protein CERZMDRAFT_82362 [Cercospora zeae-maydis SCOH1-5]|uniref:Uncharacterized protein n=1 Tax=Cercospora zeae-maydis SCOH1-5 TaxID=717836 RepID=A0A6A6FPW5_9PEZI|nr:hypothetical protein CERZMDRAFT_82362 [Cercospora zeae-maydis SCOH1-5]